MILYFSGSGNSRYVAKELGTLLNDEVVSLNRRIKKNDTSMLVSDKPYVIVCPIYAWRIPQNDSSCISRRESRSKSFC